MTDRMAVVGLWHLRCTIAASWIPGSFFETTKAQLEKGASHCTSLLERSCFFSRFVRRALRVASWRRRTTAGRPGPIG